MKDRFTCPHCRMDKPAHVRVDRPGRKPMCKSCAEKAKARRAGSR